MNRVELQRPERAPRLAEAETAIRRHWTLYLMEGAELAAFMLSACAFAVLLFHPHSAGVHWLPNSMARRLAMGVAMAMTAVLIIESPLGKRTGGHFNPAVTCTFYFLGKVSGWDAVLYGAAQFAGGACGVSLAARLWGRELSDPAVRYIVTVPGRYGTAAAFLAELAMAAFLMGVVLRVSNNPQWSRYASACVGVLVAAYIFLLSPVSGFSINPARTASSGIVAGIWTSAWIYFTAPLLGMLAAAAQYVLVYGAGRVQCAKLSHASRLPIHLQFRSKATCQPDCEALKCRRNKAVVALSQEKESHASEAAE